MGWDVSNCMALPTQQLEDLFSKGLLVRPHPDLYILGVVHIGSKSARDAEVLIETVKPLNVVVEVPPSRLEYIRQRSPYRANSETSDETDQPNQRKKQSDKKSLVDMILLLPALANIGYTKGGLSGLLFCIIMFWPSLLKQATISNEEEETLPRENEFEAAIFAAEKINANIIPADIEFDELVRSAAKSMTPSQWVELSTNILCESIGLKPKDPIKRGKDESLVVWETRRRDVKSARASQAHMEKSTPELSRVFVDKRNDKFASACLNTLHNDEFKGESTVCIVGLVHLDGIAEFISSEY